MTDTDTATPLSTARSDAARSLAEGLGADEGTVAALLLEMLEPLEAFVAIKDTSTGAYVHTNARMAALFERTPQSMRGAIDAELMAAPQAQALRTAEQAALAKTGVVLSDHRFEHAGRKRDFRVTRLAVPRHDGSAPRHVISLWVELTEAHLREAQLKTALMQLEQQQVAAEQLRREAQDAALRDGATGLYQRPHFDDQLRREVDLSSREHREFALVMIALDAPVDAVRAHGAEARTRVLEALGRLLRSNTRAMDASCRLDEDRFSILLSGVGLATAHARMEGLRRQCATQIVVLGGHDFGFSVSMGVASFPHTAHTQEDLTRAADQALAEAQKRGGNHVTLASIRFELE
jgi:diguanylate cyclase (GGDEF)-like protein